MAHWQKKLGSPAVASLLGAVFISASASTPALQHRSSSVTTSGPAITTTTSARTRASASSQAATGGTSGLDAVGTAASAAVLGLASIVAKPLPSIYGTCSSNPQGAPGPYTYSSIVNSNGYNTYVDNNMWGANAGTTQTICATGPGLWSVTANAGPKGYTGVQTYPNVQQLFTDWTGSGWNQGPNMSPTPISALHTLSSTYATSNPSVGDFEAGYDIWLNDTPAKEVMIWVYNVNRGTGGSTVLAKTTLFGLPVTLMKYGSGELILSIDKNQASGTIDILSALEYLQSKGLVSSSATIGQIDFGWEICNTAGQQLSFGLSNYSLRGS